MNSLKRWFRFSELKDTEYSAGASAGRRDYYVYFHKTPGGEVFYVGKGTGNRAWSTDRHPVWEKYVSERLDGHFEVEIVRDGLLEEEAEELERLLICQHGENLVNWVNPGRNFDYEAIERYHKLRNENRKFVTETRQIERKDQLAAAERYRRALDAMREYEAITKERGLIAELGGGPDWGDPNILDRLTLCLIRAGKPEEAIEEADRYFSEFPSALTLSLGKRIIRRIEKLRSSELRAQQTHAADDRTSRG